MSYPFVVPSGVNLIPYISGTDTLGSSSNPFAAVNAIAMSGNNLYRQSVEIFPTSGTGLISVTNGLVSTTATNYTDTNARAVVSGTSPISVSNGLVSIPSGSSLANGYISSGDWINFNSKQSSGNYIVSGSSTSLNILTVNQVNGNVLSGTTISGTDINSTSTIRINGSNVILSSSNLGSGIGIYSTKVVNQLGFKSLTGYGSVVVTSGTNDISISGTNYVLPSTVVQSASNSGVGISIYNSQSGSNLSFNTISGVGSITLFGPTNGVISISGSSAGGTSSGTNLGIGFPVFNSLDGSNLQFNSISGAGSLTNSVSVIGNTIIISGSTAAGTGDVVGPNSSILNSVATYANTSGKLLQDATGVTVSPSGVLNANIISGTTISGNEIYFSGTRFFPPILAEIDFGSLPTCCKQFIISDARVTSNSLINVQPVALATTGRTNDDYFWDNIEFTAGAGSGSITIYASTDPSITVLGTRKIQYTIY